MASALDRVMQDAETAADNFQAPAPITNNQSLQQVGQGTGTAVARPSIDNMVDSAGITVDEYLRIDKAGFQLGEMKLAYFHEMKVEIDMEEVVAIVSARGTTQGGSTKFIKSYDGVTTATGENFQQALAALRQQYQKVDGPYQTAEIPCELLDDVVVKAGKEDVTIPAGTQIGITPSLTGAKSFTKFVKALRKEGKDKDTVNVLVTHLQRTNTANNTWGVAEYALAD